MQTRHPHPPRLPRRRGATIVELLVAIAILSILAAIMLPAVQNVRESSRKMQCQTNLRNLVVACQSHEAARQAFPYTATRYRDHDGVDHPTISAQTHLLPHLDQNSLYQTIVYDHVAYEKRGTRPRSYYSEPPGVQLTRPANVEALTTTVAVFVCPSDRQVTAGNNYRACMGYGMGVFRPRKGRTCQSLGDAAGAFENGRRVRPGEFKDGLSNTAMFSERLIGDENPQHYTPWADIVHLPDPAPGCTEDEVRNSCRLYVTPDPEVHDSYNGTTWLFGGWRHTWYNHLLAPNSEIPDCRARGGFAQTARSFHAGGVNLGMADGSARFVNQSIDLTVWRALSTRASQENTVFQ